MEYIGTIVAPNGGSANNLGTASPFNIDEKFSRLRVITPTGSVTYRIRCSTDLNVAATANDYGIGSDSTAELELPVGPGGQSLGTAVVAIYGDGGTGSVKCYGLYGPLTS